MACTQLKEIQAYNPLASGPKQKTHQQLGSRKFSVPLLAGILDLVTVVQFHCRQFYSVLYLPSGRAFPLTASVEPVAAFALTAASPFVLIEASALVLTGASTLVFSDASALD